MLSDIRVQPALIEVDIDITGGGNLDTADGTYVGFIARTEDGITVTGRTRIDTANGHTFRGVSDVITEFTVNTNEASWSGTGKWDGAVGHSYDIAVVDNRDWCNVCTEPADRASITVYDPGGSIVFYDDGELATGNLRITR